jgi:DME family drug/metabolite transporter
MSVRLALVASLCFGFQTLAVEHGLSQEDDSTILAAATLTLATSTAVLWTVVGVQRGVPTVPTLAVLVPFVVAGVADPGLSRLLFYEGIDRLGPAVAAGILAANPAIGALIAVPVLGEQFAAVEAVGVALVVAGVVGIQLARPSTSDTDGVDGADDVDDIDDIDAVRRELAGATPRDLLVPGLGAVLLAASFVLVKVGFDAYSDTLVATTIAQTAALLLVAPVALRSRSARQYARRASPRAIGAFLFAGITVGTGWYAMFLALELGTVVTVLPLVSTYPLVVVVGTYAAARELPKSPTLLAAVLAIVLGAAAVQVV